MKKVQDCKGCGICWSIAAMFGGFVNGLCVGCQEAEKDAERKNAIIERKIMFENTPSVKLTPRNS